METTKTLVVPAADGTTERYNVPVGEYTTVLDALEWIRARHEPDLVYRHSCHHGSCGTCGMLIDGEPALVCITRLRELGSEVHVDPLNGVRSRGGLVVDSTPVYHAFPAPRSYLRPVEQGLHKAHRPARGADGRNNGPYAPREIPEFTRFENCIECGLCVAACPVDKPFIGPAALAAYNRELEKDPSQKDTILPRVAEPDGVDACERALRCSAVCPTGVNPAKHIALLKRKLQSD